MPQAPIYKGIPGAVLFVQNQVPFVKTGDSMIGISEYQKQGRRLRVGDRRAGSANRIALITRYSFLLLEVLC